MIIPTKYVRFVSEEEMLRKYGSQLFFYVFPSVERDGEIGYLVPCKKTHSEAEVFFG